MTLFKQMNWTIKKTIAASILGIFVIGMLALFLGRPIYAKNACTYPKAWLQVKPGMTAERSREILGYPTVEGLELKGLDYWRCSTNGIDMQLNLCFTQDINNTYVISSICMYKRFAGQNYDVQTYPDF
jgi:hypothetical protein